MQRLAVNCGWLCFHTLDWGSRRWLSSREPASNWSSTSLRVDPHVAGRAAVRFAHQRHHRPLLASTHAAARTGHALWPIATCFISCSTQLVIQGDAGPSRTKTLSSPFQWSCERSCNASAKSLLQLYACVNAGSFLHPSPYRVQPACRFTLPQRLAVLPGHILGAGLDIVQRLAHPQQQFAFLRVRLLAPRPCGARPNSRRRTSNVRCCGDHGRSSFPKNNFPEPYSGSPTKKSSGPAHGAATHGSRRCCITGQMQARVYLHLGQQAGNHPRHAPRRSSRPGVDSWRRLKPIGGVRGQSTRQLVSSMPTPRSC